MKKASSSAFAAVIMFGLLAGSGEAGEGKDGRKSEFPRLYVVNFSSNNIVGYELGANGKINPITESPFPAGTGPSAIIVHPTGRFAYVASARSHNIMGYHVGSSGALRLVAGSPFPAGTTPKEMAMDADGRYLYVLNVDSQNISAYRIDHNSGVLTPTAGSPFGAGSRPIKIAVNGRVLYVLNSRSNNISLFSIQELGSLKAEGHIATGSEPSTFVFVLPNHPHQLE